MSTVAMEVDRSLAVQNGLFTANLEDNSNFVATITELKSGSSPGRGDIWVVVATDRRNNVFRTFTITFSKNVEDATATITENDEEVNLYFNNYEDLTNPTWQAAKKGTIRYTLNPLTKTFVGNFIADIKKKASLMKHMCVRGISIPC